MHDPLGPQSSRAVRTLWRWFGHRAAACFWALFCCFSAQFRCQMQRFGPNGQSLPGAQDPIVNHMRVLALTDYYETAIELR